MPHEYDESFAGPSLNGSGAALTPPSRLPDLLQRLGLDQEQGQDALPVARLLADLDDGAWYRRAAAVRKLADLGEQAPLEALLKALNDPHVSVRANAVHVLARLGARAPVEQLAEALLGDSEWQVRESAAYALEALGARANGTVVGSSARSRYQRARRCSTRAGANSSRLARSRSAASTDRAIRAAGIYKTS